MEDKKDPTLSDEHIETRTVHAGQRPDSRTGAVTVPIYATSTYAQVPGVDHPYEYSRVQNPTREALETACAALEGTRYATAFSSGMAAIDALIRACPPHSHVVAGLNAYGGTIRLLDQVWVREGRTFTFVYPVTFENIREACQPSKTALILIETPSNPCLDIVSIEKVAEIAHMFGCYLAVDNTFMSPYLQNPVEHGADVVIHSTTKYLNGHSDSIGGVLCYNDDMLDEKIRFIVKSAGAILSPFESWLILRGLRTLHVRMDRHVYNARRLVEALLGHPAIERVYYPELETHPGHDIHMRQARAGGGMVSFSLKPGLDPLRFFRHLKICIYGESLGGVETLISHPATMTHASLTEETRKKLGVTENLVRVSVGIENCDDIIGDILEALDRAKEGG